MALRFEDTNIGQVRLDGIIATSVQQTLATMTKKEHDTLNKCMSGLQPESNSTSTMHNLILSHKLSHNTTYLRH